MHVSLIMEICDFLAGIDTTRYTLDWIICYLTAHQDVQVKCHEEIDEAIGRLRNKTYL